MNKKERRKDCFHKAQKKNHNIIMAINRVFSVISDSDFLPVKSLLSLQDHDYICAVAGSSLHTAPVLKNKSPASLNIIDSLIEFFY